MKHYIGLDVSMEETAVCVIDEQGQILHEEMVPTEPEDIARSVQRFGDTVELVGLESGSLSHWLTEELLAAEIPVKCIDARHCASFLALNINKTDRNDARGIAQIMRFGSFREVHIKPRETRALAALLTGREQLVKQRVQTLTTIRGFLKPAGIRLGTISRREAGLAKIREAASGLEAHIVKTIDALLTALQATMASIADLDQQIHEYVKGDSNAQLLMTIPGVGPITAVRYLVDIGEPNRFTHSRSVGAYVGLTPKQYSSGETQKQGKISKCGPKELRSRLVEAAVVMLTRTQSWSKLKAWGLKLMKRNGLKKAATAVARKLAVIMHRMLVNQEAFRFGDPEPKRATA